jgi:hypothetical protein
MHKNKNLLGKEDVIWGKNEDELGNKTNIRDAFLFGVCSGIRSGFISRFLHAHGR